MTTQPWHLNYLKATATTNINKQPHSIQFDDVYFNDMGGVAESNYVFIESNHLIQRWQSNQQHSNFCIAETGFGTGLNFLVTLKAWQSTSDKPQKMHFISCEKYPLNYQDMYQAHACFPELHQYSQQLLSIWQDFNDVFRAGFHTFHINNNITLTLAFGDATANLTQLNAAVDAWYLDGFAPNKNPDMWHDDLMTEISRLSHSHTTLATFTAATTVKKTLEQNGFEVSKITGFGKKREMITACFKQHNTNSNDAHQWHPMPESKAKKNTVTILGGGIAGMCLAHYFKQANYHVTVIDQNPRPMQVASGNDLAMVMPLLTTQQSPESAFYVRAFESALRFYTTNEMHAIGVEQYLEQTKQQLWKQAIKQYDLPHTLIQLSGQSTALYPQAGFVDTRAVAQRLETAVDQWITAEIDQLKLDEIHHWQLHDQDSNLIAAAELLIIANGIQAQHLLRPHDLSLTAKHGMTTTFNAPLDCSLKHIQLAKGYVIPYPNQQQLLCGATFDHLSTEDWFKPAKLHDDHQQRNVETWQGTPLFEPLNQSQVLSGHAAIRATTADHLPVCGPIIDQVQFELDYHDLHHGRHWQQYPPAKSMDNLYVLNGLGSRGFTSAPLLAQHLCAMITGEPLPLEDDLCKIIHPNRFLYRSLKKTPNT
jgi:tRNA 5-methylaminomethyl-2-thiouridine biosynthesis bifunctional protein